MGKKEVRVMETKLDILIMDFQRFRETQARVNEVLKDHSSEENAVQAKILTTLRWHSIIGAGLVSAMGYLYLHVNLV